MLPVCVLARSVEFLRLSEDKRSLKSGTEKLQKGVTLQIQAQSAKEDRFNRSLLGICSQKTIFQITTLTYFNLAKSFLFSSYISIYFSHLHKGDLSATEFAVCELWG